MDEKKVTSGFEQKQSYVRAETLSGLYADIEKDFEEVNEILAEAGIGPCCYVPQKEKAEKIVEDYCKLNAYVLSALQQALDELDKPLYLNFKNNATETLSEIRLSEITTEVTFNICEYSDVSAIAALSESKEMLAVLSIEDFISLDDCDKFQGLVPIKGIETFELFADSFQEYFDSVSLYEGMSINKCIKTFFKIGEFDHVAYHPGKDLLSAVLDVTIIKPIIEMIVGYDLITEERLSDFEKAMKGVDTGLNLVVLASSLVGLGQLGLSGKELCLRLFKTAAVEVSTDSVATFSAYGSQELGASPLASVGIGILSGALTGSVAGAALLKSPKTTLSRLSADELDELIKGAYREADIDDIIKNIDIDTFKSDYSNALEILQLDPLEERKYLPTIIRKLRGYRNKAALSDEVTKDFVYKHNPSENPKVLLDAIEDPGAVYGYRPTKDGSLSRYAYYDWSDPQKVKGYREKRINYHIENEILTQKIIVKMSNEGASTEDIARAVCDCRNKLRIKAYLDESGEIFDLDGYKVALKRAERNTYENLIMKGKTPEEIIESATKANPAMDACTGLYDIYYNTY